MSLDPSRFERNLKMIGKFSYDKLSAGEIIAVENRFDGRSLKCQFLFAYNRIIINGKCFSSALYSADFKRDNSVVRLIYSFVIIEKFVVLNENYNCHDMPNEGCMMKHWSHYSQINQPHKI